MALIKEKPADVASSNDLDGVEVPQEGTPPAYLVFGTSPCAVEDPPALGEVRTYIMRTRCTGEHGPIERKDGEQRYTRTLSVQYCYEEGKPKPPDPDDDQPGLFDEGGAAVDGDGGGDE